MCPDTCLAYTGPFAALEECPLCGISRWNQEKLRASHGRIKVAARKFTTILLGPEIQGLYPSSGTSQADGEIPVVDDVTMGWDYLGAVLDGDIKPDDVVLMVSMDGAQLYDSKASDCWMYIWIVLNLSPDKCYRKAHVLPGGFIPGPNKPKNVDSFLFVGMHHLAALQREGLRIWNASHNINLRSDLYLLFMTADGPGLVYWDGMVGHSGKNGCRMYCGITGCDHGDLNIFDLPLGGSDDYDQNLLNLTTSPSQRQLDIRKTQTGITKPPLILGLDPTRSLGVPLCMTTDIMHLAGNLSDLFLSLWRGTMDCAATDDINTWGWAVFRDVDTWTAHGQSVAEAGCSLPGSYGRKPRNIAEKLNTSYKTWELDSVPPFSTTYSPSSIGLTTANFITAQELKDTHSLFCNWEDEFERIYYKLQENRLHFVRPCIHQVSHLVTETIQKGPPICYVQWTMERTIGNLGQEICQPSQPYANLSQEGVRRCQVNALLSAIPTLAIPPKGLPEGAVDLRDGFALLHKRDKNHVLPVDGPARTIQHFLGAHRPLPKIKRWARLLIPNGQIAWTVWREKLKAREDIRASRNIKFTLDGRIRFTEVQYFTRLAIGEDHLRFINVAVLQLYSMPDEELLRLSMQTYATCTLLDELLVIDVKQIIGVIAMVPQTTRLPGGEIKDRFFLVERLGLELSDLGVAYSVYQDIEEDRDNMLE
ncbi:hypothetical protein PAXINDRAFT_17364 [Paxillus involutus ATCC 200175]|uniref:Uncharacterized protein n=1 Tax=Paxillus involutus ATCC 200175 TaxID=664439 RepID=A0A0C9SQD4_PAXIN|nr:hypothetical protein PAXINDRAFT_17364 [Paxillus involutus ATCC 200175]